MFSILRKTSVIHLDCFTYSQDILDLFPITEAKSFSPKWYKDLPPTVQYQGPKRGTMKTCPGITDLFKKGFIIPSWRDYYAEMRNGIPSIVPEEEGEIHHPDQWGDGLKGYGHIKLIAPWYIKEKTGVSFFFTNTYWNSNITSYFIPNGVVDYKNQHSANVNMVVAKKIFPNNFNISAGEPLAHVIPLSEKKIKIHLHVVSRIEFNDMQPYNFSFASQYYKRKKMGDEK